MAYTEIRIETPEGYQEGRICIRTNGISSTGHIHFTDFYKKSKHELNVPGVYVWGFYQKGRFYPLYIGKTMKVFKRFIEHYCSLRGGAYQMFEMRSILNATGPSHLPNIKNIMYEPKCLSDIFHFPSLIKELELQKILDNFTFRYTEITDKKEREDGEKCLTENVLEKLCGKDYLTRLQKGEWKRILLSGKRMDIDQYAIAKLKNEISGEKIDSIKLELADELKAMIRDINQ